MVNPSFKPIDGPRTLATNFVYRKRVLNLPIRLNISSGLYKRHLMDGVRPASRCRNEPASEGNVRSSLFTHIQGQSSGFPVSMQRRAPSNSNG
jgi:hypothetical protein